MLSRVRSVGYQAQTRLRAAAGLPNTFFAAAVDCETIWPDGVVEGAPATVLDGQFERATCGAFGLSIAEQVAALRGGGKKIYGTKLYQFRDVCIASRRVISGGSFEQFSWPNRSWSFNSTNDLGVGILYSSYQGCRYFGHWLRDDCATSLLPDNGVQRYNLHNANWSDCAGYLNWFGCEFGSYADDSFFDELYYYDDIHQNEHKRGRLILLRDSLRKSVASNSAGSIVYLKRGKSGAARRLVNEQDLIESLERIGVKIICAEERPIEEIMPNILDASIIISIEGSQLSHALYALHDRGGILVIQPPDRMFISHFDWARMMGVKFGMVVGVHAGDGFFVNFDEILKTIELMNI